MNHKELLTKYVKFVEGCEGVDFIPDLKWLAYMSHNNTQFDKEEEEEG